MRLLKFSLLVLALSATLPAWANDEAKIGEEVNVQTNGPPMMKPSIASREIPVPPPPPPPPAPAPIVAPPVMAPPVSHAPAKPHAKKAKKHKKKTVKRKQCNCQG
jgi:hypothetical protein